jgi:glycosyltransferase involved in cell wall biosynthesis
VTEPVRIAAVTPFAPRLDAPHGGRAAAHLLMELASRHRVALVSVCDADERPVDPALAERCDEVLQVVRPTVRRRQLRLLAGLARGIPTAVADNPAGEAAHVVSQLVANWRPDVLHLEGRSTARYLPSHSLETPALLVDHDPRRASPFELGRRSRAAGVFDRADKRAWRRWLAATNARVDLVVVFTDPDRETVLDAGSVATEVIPLSLPDPGPLSARGESPPTVVFVGGLMHPPNLDAARRLARTIFPAVRDRVPDAELVLIGPPGTAPTGDLNGPGVRYLGFVPEVDAYLGPATLLAAPLRLGSGMRVKVAEALAAGKAVVASRLAVEGLNVEDGTHFVGAGSDGEFADAIVRVLADAELRERMGAAARAHVLAVTDVRRAATAYERCYRALLATSDER